MIKKKLYLVKREVIATSVKQALTAKGHVYEIALANENTWPTTSKKDVGFKKK